MIMESKVFFAYGNAVTALALSKWLSGIEITYSVIFGFAAFYFSVAITIAVVKSTLHGIID